MDEGMKKKVDDYRKHLHDAETLLTEIMLSFKPKMGERVEHDFDQALDGIIDARCRFDEVLINYGLEEE